MNNAQMMNADVELVSRALDALEASAGIQGELISATSADTTVSLTINGRHLQYDCEVKKRVDRYALPLDLVHRLGDASRTLLVSAALSQDMANRCREIGLQFIDTAGNAYIDNGDGIYIHVTGRRDDDWVQAPSNNTVTPAMVRMMFAFLANPALLNAPYREISFQAQVSTGSVGKAFDTLEARGLIGTTADGERLIRNAERFLHEWASNYAGRLRPKLRKYRFATDGLDKILGWIPDSRSAALGGEPAAGILTKHLRPEECTIYIDMADPQALRDLVKEFRLRADPHGPIEIVEMFWNTDYFTRWLPTVPPHLVYADLMATHNSRNMTVARQIAAGVIEHVHDTKG